MTAVEQLSDLLVELSRALTDISTSSMFAVHADVTPNQYRALVVLEQHGQMSVAHFARSCAIDRSTATRLCDRLVKKGLIDRERSFRDRRSVNVQLTATARGLLDAISQHRRDRISVIVQDFPETSYAQLVDSLDMVTKAMVVAVRSDSLASN